MKILIVGGGGREHALAWKSAATAEKVFVAPGNAGTALEPRVENVPIAADDVPALLEFARRESPDLTIIGPETPLVAGIVDEFMAAGLPCFGPARAAARLEGSKTFCKEFLSQHRIPTAAYRSFTDPAEARDYIRAMGAPIVIKADGLAAGKGVVVAWHESEALDAVTQMLEDNRFGASGRRIVVEEFLEGEEASFIVMCDGRHILPLASSQDHKARDDGDRGPNTGGMGAYSPAPVVSPEVHRRIMESVIVPTVRGMAAQGTPYTGFLYAGLMITDAGEPKVLEFNCRFGDPETQPIIMRLQADINVLCLSAVQGDLDSATVSWDPRAALGVVLAAEGYPGKVRTGDPVAGLDRALPEHVKIFHAGTALQGSRVVTAGGRVLCVTALGETVAAARQYAYAAVDGIHWPGMLYRRDIGRRAILREAG